MQPRWEYHSPQTLNARPGSIWPNIVSVFETYLFVVDLPTVVYNLFLDLEVKAKS